MADESVKLGTAKLLESKGFGKAYNRYTRTPLVTQTAAARWLREKKNLYVAIFRSAFGWGYIIDKADSGTNICNCNDSGPNGCCVWDDFEAAMEAGIVEAITLI